MISTPVLPKTTAQKAPAVYQGPISPSGTCTGIIFKMLAHADDAKLVVLNAMGAVVSETSKHVTDDQSPLAISFQPSFAPKRGELHFLLVKGYVKGVLSWELRLGRYKA